MGNAHPVFCTFYLLELCPILVDLALCIFKKYNNLKGHIKKNPQFFLNLHTTYRAVATGFFYFCGFLRLMNFIGVC